MIDKGYGSIFVRVFNEAGTEVYDRVTSLYYTHSEKVDDSSRIIIETTDVSIVDNPNLQEGKVLKVVFGYVGEKPRSHTVWIWDIIPNFTPEGIRMEIVGYCKAAYMSLNSSKDVYSDMTLDEMVEEMASQYNIKKELANLDKSNIQRITTGEKTLSKLDVSGPNAFTTVARDNTAYVIDYTFKRYQSLPQGNKSDTKMINETAKNEPIDNLVVEGRDDRLIIKRRNLVQEPFKSYRYKGEPGHLLEFTPASHNRTKRKTSVATTVSTWDEENKEYKQTTVSAKESGAPIMGDEVEWSGESQFIESLKKNKNPLDRPISAVSSVQFYDYSQKDERGNPITRKLTEETLEATKRNYAILARQGYLASQGRLPAGAGHAFVYVERQGANTNVLTIEGLKATANAPLDTTGRIRTREMIILSPSETLHLMEPKHGDAVGAATNRQANKLAEATECNAIMLGDPDLESGKIISILGVGKKYSGNYYIVAVNHELTPNGYTCNCTIFKTGKNKLVDKDTNMVDANTLGLTKNKEVSLPNDGTSELSKVPIRKD